mgnify:CR=1 FL=1
MQKLRKLVGSRIFIGSLLVLIQLVGLYVAVVWFRRFFVLYSAFSLVLGITFTIMIINTNQHMAYKFAWCVVILFFPCFGVLLYLFFSGNRISKHQKRKLQNMDNTIARNTGDKRAVIDELEKSDPDAARQVKYILTSSECPPYTDCDVTYFPSGEDMFGPLIEEIKKARKYIFLEYFIIGDGEMWSAIHSILLQKVKEGVDVRVIYDDVGSMFSVDQHFYDIMNAEGIRCHVFNKVKPVLSGRSNNRDHRKICSIDGKVAFTGGINLADEYINKIVRFGYWKDTALMIKGEAAWSLTVLFLNMWEHLDKVDKKERGDYAKYKPTEPYIGTGRGVIEPYTDDPYTYQNVGEHVYLNMIASAKKYIWIMTPYLITDEQMETALSLAAKSGVDVRIITPGIPDKKLVKMTTESHYQKLINNGVKIYEFEPGFIHAKNFLVDGKYATVGTINLDFRSLYLHFECGAWMCDTDCIKDIEADFNDTFSKCRQIEEWKTGRLQRMFYGVLEIIAPLL